MQYNSFSDNKLIKKKCNFQKELFDDYILSNVISHEILDIFIKSLVIFIHRKIYIRLHISKNKGY